MDKQRTAISEDIGQRTMKLEQAVQEQSYEIATHKQIIGNQQAAIDDARF